MKISKHMQNKQKNISTQHPASIMINSLSFLYHLYLHPLSNFHSIVWGKMSIYLNIQILVVQFWQMDIRIYPTPLSLLHACAQPCLTATPWTVAMAPLFMRFPRQNDWSGLPFPTLGDLPDTEIKSSSPACPALAGRFFTTSATWEALIITQDISVSLDGSLLLLTSSLATTSIFFKKNLRLKSQALVRTRFQP